MRVNVNLATHKYEDARAFFIRWGSALAAAAVLFLVLGTWAWLNYSSSSASRKRVNEIRSRIDTLDKQKAAAEAILNRPENHDVREQSAFWNAQIAEKTFSWTQLFTDLEKLMPSRAYVLSVSPSITKENQLKLTLIIGGEKHEDAVELVRRMEASPRFRFPVLKSENFHNDQKGSAATVQFSIEAFYTPSSSLADSPVQTAKEGM